MELRRENEIQKHKLCQKADENVSLHYKLMSLSEKLAQLEKDRRFY